MEILINSSNSKNKIYLDSNVIINFKEDGAIFHQNAIDIIETILKENLIIVLSPLTLDESIHGILRDLRVLRDKDPITKTRSIFKDFLKTFKIEMLNSPLDIKSQLKIIDYIEKFNLRPRDAYHLLIMKKNKIRYFATFDSDFDKVFEENVLKRYPI